MLPNEQSIDTTPILAQPREFAQRLARVERERAELIETVSRLRAECNDAQAEARAYILRTERAEAEVERLTAVLTALINQADVAWATLDHTENERFVSRLGDAIDNARMALRQPAPARQDGN